MKLSFVYYIESNNGRKMDYRELIQSVWPDWQVKQILGKGSYGTVFKAVKEKYGVIKESAIKLVHIPTDNKGWNGSWRDDFFRRRYSISTGKL